MKAPREMHDITGFASKEGEPLPNDDLDLQLAWLRAVDELGPQNINSKTLGEYWISWVTPHWNEYGICKANMRDGCCRPLRRNQQRRMEAFQRRLIRTEVWACLYPAMVEQAPASPMRMPAWITALARALTPPSCQPRWKAPPL